MKRFFLFLLVVLGCWVLESSVRWLPLGPLRWDGLFLIILYCGFSTPIFPGVFWVTLLGLGQESVGCSLHGPLLFSYLFVYFFLRLAREQLFFEGRLALGAWVFLMTLLQKSIQGGLLVWKGFPFVPDFSMMFAEGLLEAATSLVFFALLRRMRGLEAR